ncbi:hypothetical protein BDZ94DRAFT_1315471, partial [Collybia nuda]
LPSQSLQLPLFLCLSFSRQELLRLRLKRAEVRSARVLFKHDLVLWCEKIVKQFKEGSILQPRTISLLAGILIKDGPSQESDSALELFIEQVLSHSSSLRQAAKRGEASYPGEQLAPITNDPPDEPDPSDDGQGPSKRRHNPEDKDLLPEDIAGEDEHLRSSKKRLIFEHELPWFANDLIAQALLHPDLVKTQKT